MFNNSKMKLPQDTTTPPQAADEAKLDWKGGTYNKVLHAIDPKACAPASAKSFSLKSDLFEKTKHEEVNPASTGENKKTARLDT